MATYEGRAASRGDFNTRLRAQEPEAIASGWQRHYTRGEKVAGRRRNSTSPGGG